MKCGYINCELVEDEFFAEITPWVESLAKKVARSLPEGSYELQELISAGYIGVLEARERFDASKEVPFKKYAYLRVRGAIIDQVRKECFLSVTAGKYAGLCKDSESSGKLTSEKQKQINERAKDNALAFRVEYFEDSHSSSENIPQIEEAIDKVRTLKKVSSVIDSMNEREKKVVKDYYESSKTFAEIGDKLDMTRAGVWKIHNRAIKKIKEEIFKEAA